jgi:hypothetical protein
MNEHISVECVKEFFLIVLAQVDCGLVGFVLARDEMQNAERINTTMYYVHIYAVLRGWRK